MYRFFHSCRHLFESFNETTNTLKFNPVYFQTQIFVTSQIHFHRVHLRITNGRKEDVQDLSKIVTLDSYAELQKRFMAWNITDIEIKYHTKFHEQVFCCEFYAAYKFEY